MIAIGAFVCRNARRWGIASSILASTIAATAANAQTLTVGAWTRGEGIDRLSFSGRWEFIRDVRDGRYAGRSARTFHGGDSVTLFFHGRRLRIFGISGPNGGKALLSLGNRSSLRTIDFYAPQKHAHALLYASASMPPGFRLAELTVLAPVGSTRRRFVNIDAIEIEQ